MDHFDKMMVASLDLHVAIRQIREDFKQGRPADGDKIRKVQEDARKLAAMAGGL